MKKNDFIKVILRVCIYGIIVLGAVGAIYRDAQMISGSKFGENSFTEWTQNIFLFLSVVIYGYIAYRFPVCRKTAILFGGFTFIMLIREMDSYFDLLFHGAWFYIVLPILFYLVYLFVKHRKAIMQNLTKYFTTSAFGILLSSSVSIFLFSRLFGKKDLWRFIFETEHLSQTQRWVKNCAEEGSELFGYSLFLIAAIEVLYFFYRKKSFPND